MIKKLIILSAAIMLVGASGCSDSSSSVSMTDSEVYESRLEKFVEEENPYAFLPDGVRMDDTEHVYEVVPDSEGMIDLEKLGFKYAAPAGSTTYVYECDPLENEGRNSNYTCTASAFITNSLFPQSTEAAPPVIAVLPAGSPARRRNARPTLQRRPPDILPWR